MSKDSDVIMSFLNIRELRVRIVVSLSEDTLATSVSFWKHPSFPAQF